VEDRGTLKHICMAERKGTAKRAVEQAVLEENHGLVGDAHAGNRHLQVSLLDEADIATMRSKGLDLEPGAFGENFVVQGLDLGLVGIGTRIGIGEGEIEVTQIGKVCHTRCAIYDVTGDCIMPRSGVFARAVKGARLSPGMPVEVIRLVPRHVTQAAVLTVSDRCAAGETADTAGPAVALRLGEALGAWVGWTGTVPDEAAEISGALKDLCGRGIDLVLTVGGTGCSGRDVTPEATRAVIEKEVPGLAEAMRIASARVTPHALLGRGVCGIYRSSLILNLPGSKKAAVENLEAVLAALPHAVDQLRGRGSHVEDGKRGTQSAPDRSVGTTGRSVGNHGTRAP